MINGHGNNIYQHQNIEADFSSNIAFNNNSKKLIDHLSQHLESIKDYPDPNCTMLTNRVAQMYGVDDSNVLITNGSAEAFYLIAHLLSRHGQTNTVITTPSFSEYEDSCTLYNHDIEYVALNDLTSSSLDDYTSVWLCSPNNPDGYTISQREIEVLAMQYPKCYFVVDRAYNDLLQNSESMTLPMCDNTIVINSFTKSYGIPGLRLGHIIASQEVIAKLTNMRPPWSVNSLSQIAGIYIVDNIETLHPDIDELIEESHYLQQQIGKIDGFRVTPSNCNFFLVEICGDYTSAELKEYLITNHRILIRDASNFRGLTDKCFRVATLSRSYNDLLIDTLRSLSKGGLNK